MSITSEELENAATELDIDAVGVVSVGSLKDAVGSRGKVLAGAMDLQQQVLAIMPEAISVIVLASSYNDERSSDLSLPGDPRGIIGRGLWKDYAASLRKMAEALAIFLEGKGHRAELAEDLPLRELARLAGVGTIGKNSLLQSFEAGSWVLLTALITDADLPSGGDEECRCGSCQTCIRLCPTKAITAPFRVDRERCIDHLLSSAHDIPMDLREAIGNRLLSCDVCQEACPRNKFVLPARSKAPERFGHWTRSPSLRALVMISDEQYTDYFGSMEWCTLNTYLLRRNAIIALGNSCDPSGIDILEGVLHDPDPRLRGYASWALGRIGEVAAAGSIRVALQQEQDAFAGEEMRLALARLGEK